MNQMRLTLEGLLVQYGHAASLSVAKAVVCTGSVFVNGELTDDFCMELSPGDVVEIKRLVARIVVPEAESDELPDSKGEGQP